MKIPVGGIQLALRAAVAAGLSLALAQLFRLEYPLYAMIAAVIVTDLSASQTRKLGLRRLVATVLGAACGATLGPLLLPGPVAVGLSILVAMLICILLRGQDVAKVVGYICGIVVLEHGANPWFYAFFRVIETVLGIGVAWLISLVPKLIRTDESGSQEPDAR